MTSRLHSLVRLATRSFALRARGLRASSSSPASTGFFVTGSQTSGLAEGVLHPPVLQRVEADDPGPPPGFTTRGSAASSRSSATELVVDRDPQRLEDARRGVDRSPDCRTQLRTTSARSAVVANGFVCRRSTIRRATRRLCRSSPYSQNTSASPASLIVFDEVRGGCAGGRVEPHVERAVVAKAQPAGRPRPSDRRRTRGRRTRRRPPSIPRFASTSGSWSKFA